MTPSFVKATDGKKLLMTRSAKKRLAIRFRILQIRASKSQERKCNPVAASAVLWTELQDLT